MSRTTQASYDSAEEKRARRVRRFEAYIELLPYGDPVYDALADAVERRVIELGSRKRAA